MCRGTVASSAKRSSKISTAGFNALQPEDWTATRKAPRQRAAEASLCVTSASNSA